MGSAAIPPSALRGDGGIIRQRWLLGPTKSGSQRNISRRRNATRSPIGAHSLGCCRFRKGGRCLSGGGDGAAPLSVPFQVGLRAGTGQIKGGGQGCRGGFFRRSLLANWLVALGRLERHRKLHQRHITVGLGVVSSFIHREGKPCFAGSSLFQLQLVGQDFQCSSLRRKSYCSRKSGTPRLCLD